MWIIMSFPDIFLKVLNLLVNSIILIPNFYIIVLGYDQRFNLLVFYQSSISVAILLFSFHLLFSKLPESCFVLRVARCELHALISKNWQSKAKERQYVS